MTKLIRFNGLNCASCANKIEIQLNNLPWIEEAKLNFNMNTINLKLKSEERYSLPFLQKLVDDIEEGVSLYDSEEKEEKLSIFKNRSLVRLIISLPLFITGLFLKDYIFLQLPLLAIAYFVSGFEVLLRAGKNILKGKIFDEFFLMSIATVGAIFIGELAEGVGVMIFFQLGEFFQGLAVGKSKRSIKKLMEIKPDFARLEDGKIMQPEDISVGDIIEVRPGEKIPLDGTVIYGETTVDTKAITGESMPRQLTNESEVLSGFINISGIIKVEVKKNYKESTVSIILNMVQNEAAKKTVTENFISKFARVYTPIVVSVAIIIAAITPLIIPTVTYNSSIYKALIFLVISCPCALVVAVPLGYFGGIGRSSSEGILVKGSAYIEALTEVDKFAFDKTGTLTKGIFSVSETYLNNNSSNEELLKAAFLTENRSNHPIAKAITKFSGFSDSEEPDFYEEVSGNGIIAAYGSDTYLAGKKEFLINKGIDIEGNIHGLGTKVFIAKNGKHLGTILLEDTLKNDSRELVSVLGEDNVYILTGDNRESAESIAKKTGIKNFKHDLLPQDKANIIRELSEKSKVLFVGDGINDAPVLAASHVGVSMGGIGSDAAIEASDVVLMTDEPSKVIKAVKIAKYTKMIIIQNIVIALGFKAIIMILGLLGFAGLWLAIFADVGVTLIAVLNSMRTLRKKFNK